MSDTLVKIGPNHKFGADVRDIVITRREDKYDLFFIRLSDGKGDSFSGRERQEILNYLPRGYTLQEPAGRSQYGVCKLVPPPEVVSISAIIEYTLKPGTSLDGIMDQFRTAVRLDGASLSSVAFLDPTVIQ